jgi:hypothetical protein
MMIDAGLPPYLWPLAVETAVYLLNRLKSPNQEKPLAQIWREFFKLPEPEVTLRHVRKFGSKAYYTIPKEKRVQAEEMAPRRRIGYIVGYIGDYGHLLGFGSRTEKNSKQHGMSSFMKERMTILYCLLLHQALLIIPDRVVIPLMISVSRQLTTIPLKVLSKINHEFLRISLRLMRDL